MNSDKPTVLIWDHPSQGSFVSRIVEHAPGPDNPSPLAVGTLLRSGRKIGRVVAIREHDGTPISGKSVAVECFHSSGRFPNLDKSEINVWSLSCSQILKNGLRDMALSNPEALIEQFEMLEKKYAEEARKTRELENRRNAALSEGGSGSGDNEEVQCEAV